MPAGVARPPLAAEAMVEPAQHTAGTWCSIGRVVHHSSSDQYYAASRHTQPRRNDHGVGVWNDVLGITQLAREHVCCATPYNGQRRGACYHVDDAFRVIGSAP